MSTRFLICGSFSEQTYVLDVDTGSVIQINTLPKKGARHTIQLSDSHAMTTCDDGKLYLWNVLTGIMEGSIDTGIARLQFGLINLKPPASCLVGAGGNGDFSIRLVDPLASDETDALRATLSGHTRGVFAFEQPVLRPEVLISSALYETCKVWDLETQTLLKTLVLGNLGGRAMCCDDVNQVLYVGRHIDGRVMTWDLRMLENIGGVLASKWSRSRCVDVLRFRQSKHQLVIPYYHGTIRVVDTRFPGSVLYKWNAHSAYSRVFGLCDVPDSDTLVTTAFRDDQSVQAWRYDGTKVWGWALKGGICQVTQFVADSCGDLGVVES